MTVVDTSALVALLFGEHDAVAVAARLEESDEVVIASATYTELAIVVEARTGPTGTRLMDQLLDEYGIEIVPFDERTASLAADGWRRFGKGRHRAALNLGDCFSYALAASRDDALLFVGQDFAATDVESALDR